MLNRRPMYYVLYKVRKFFEFEEKKETILLTIPYFFVWSEESSEYFGLGLVIRFDIFFFEYHQRREDRLIILH